jgi:hypothetical protein
MQPVRDWQQDRLDTRVTRQLPIQPINGETIGIGQRLLDDATAPDHVVEDKEAVRFHLGQENLEIGVVTGFVRIDKCEIERRAQFQSITLFRVAPIEFDAAHDMSLFQ